VLAESCMGAPGIVRVFGAGCMGSNSKCLRVGAGGAPGAQLHPTQAVRYMILVHGVWWEGAQA
jgi:hypothetical protein